MTNTLIRDQISILALGVAQAHAQLRLEVDFLALVDRAAMGFDPGRYPEFSQFEAAATLIAIQDVLATLFPNGEPPADFWATALGDALLQARCWATRDHLLTLAEAARLTGRSLSHLSNYSTRRIRRFPRPGGGFAVLESELHQNP